MAAKKKVAKKATNKGGRPTKPVDLEMLKGLADIQCTAEECSSVLGVSVDTIDRRLKAEGYGGFADFYKSHSDGGKVSLRRAQFKAALDGNPTMLIWMGKQVLGQRDKQEVEHGANDSLADLLQAISGSAGILDKARERTGGNSS